MTSTLLPPPVTEEELPAARIMGNPSNDPDGVTDRVLEIVSNILSGKIIDLFNASLMIDKLQTEWKRAGLTLLSKPAKYDWGCRPPSDQYASSMRMSICWKKLLRIESGHT